MVVQEHRFDEESSPLIEPLRHQVPALGHHGDALPPVVDKEIQGGVYQSLPKSMPAAPLRNCQKSNRTGIGCQKVAGYVTNWFSIQLCNEHSVGPSLTTAFNPQPV